MSARLATRALFFCAALASAAAAQQDPDIERGSRPGLAYQVSDLDRVNLFNGTITMNIPIGPSYRVGGTLEYSFQASYGTNDWETAYNEVELPDLTTETYPYKYPSPHSNAGFGWNVTLGALVFDANGVLNGYLAPDGGVHRFYETLHRNNPHEYENYPSLAYTRDGTYLRKTSSGSTSVVQFPNGHRHTFDAAGRLTEMRDQYDNVVTLTYTSRVSPDAHAGSTLLTVADSTGREHKIYFRPNWAYDKIEESEPNPVPINREMIDKIVLAAFNGTKAEYVFEYIAAPEEGQLPSIGHKTSRRCGARTDPTLAGYVITSLLSSITMPEAVQYSMQYDQGDHENCSYNAPIHPLGSSGNIKKLVLPTGFGVTGGRIEWAYQKYIFPGQGASTVNAGILEKKVFDGTTVLSHTSYEIDKFTRTDLAADSPYYDVWRRVVNKDGNGALVNSVKHYFTACRTTPGGTVPCNTLEYGLPLTRTQPRAGGGYLSSEIEVPGSTARRRKYVQYEGDGLLGVQVGPWVNANQRVSYEATVYENGEYADVAHSLFDGLGHYRRTVTGGNFQRGNIQTSHTNFNPAAGKYDLDAAGNLAAGFFMPSTWILTTFDQQWTYGGAETAAQAFCFDSTGFLTSRRTFKEWAAGRDAQGEVVLPDDDAEDLLATFTRNGAGDLTDERYYGGNAGSPAPTRIACGTTPPNEAYRIRHGYQHGSRNMSRYVDQSGIDLSFDVLDADIDQNTGLVAASRTHSSSTLADGVTTTYEYDRLGRLTDTYLKHPSTTTKARTDYTYHVLPPSITVADYLPDGTKLRQSTAEFDVLGRLARETRTMAGGVTASRTTKYNSLGWITQTIDWGATDPTTYSHDAFGRATSVRSPDQASENALQIAYDGISSVTRTAKVRTSGDANAVGLTNAVTTEEYDRQGRLWRITEPAQVVNGTRPVTVYTYDVMGRLSGVCASSAAPAQCGQSRSFTYDNRGFLIREVHPENGTTEYPEYDARGHLRRRYLGAMFGPHDVGFAYDRAERLTGVHRVLDGNGSVRVLKQFYFGANNTSANLRNGRLVGALRFNWVDIGNRSFNTRVYETYKYEDPLGNVSSRVTTADTCEVGGLEDCESLTWSGAPDRTFEQSFTYDVLGNVETLGYPRCVECPNLIGGRTITNGYDNGMLRSVTWTGAAVANTFTYHASGVVTGVAHDNGVTDVTTVDPNVPSRPQTITTQNAIATGCVVPAFTLQPQSVTTVAGAVPLNANAVGEDGQVVMYQWYRGVAPDTSNLITGATAASYAPTVTATTSYWVAAWNGCSAGSITPSVTATVTICSAPNVTASADQTITRTTSVTLTAAATGAPDLEYQWYKVSPGPSTLIVGATTESLPVSPDVTTQYRVVVSNACDETHSDDVVVTVVDPPTAPPSVTAFYDADILKVRLSWAVSSSGVGIARYEIQRHDGVVFDVGVSAGTTFTDAFVHAGFTYVYRIRAFDTQGVPSDLSAADFATLVTFTAPEPIPAPSGSLTLIRGVYVSELRQAIDSVRAAAGLPAAWQSYAPPAGLITAEIFTQLQARLNEARAVLLLPDVIFSDPVGAGQMIRRSCVNDLRAGVK